MQRPHRFVMPSGRRVAGVILGAVLAGGALAPAAATALPRANIVLPSVVSVDPVAQTAVFALHRGTAGGATVWYVVTDASDETDAKNRGAVYSPLLANAGTGCRTCVQSVTESNGSIAYAAAPDFSATRVFEAGPAGFPPKAAAPGAIATNGYSPFVKIGSAPEVVSAPIVATGDGPFDVTTHANTQERVVAIDTKAMTVTLLLVHGFANGKPVLYISTEASDPGVASIERATYAPALKATSSGQIPIFVVANGPSTASAGTSQGIAETALRGHLGDDATLANSGTLRAPMNVLASFPTGAGAGAYTPLWGAHLGFWSSGAVAAHRNVQLRTPDAFAAAAAKGDLTGPGGKPLGPIGVVINCPVVAYLDSAP